MNKEINLEEILQKNNVIKGSIDSNMALQVDRDYYRGIQRRIYEAMKEACEQAIDLCADNAEADYTYNGGEYFYPEDIEVYVLKNSILDCKKFIK